MVPKIYPTWSIVLPKLARHLYTNGLVSKSNTWQGIEGREMLEVINICFSIQKPEMLVGLKPNLPWADVHFEERVSGIPYNPPPSHKIWPFAQKSNSAFINEEKFSHTYPERFWPKIAGTPKDYSITEETFKYVEKSVLKIIEDDYRHKGIRFPYGDLDDVIYLLKEDKFTRQAYLPIWFPEDTGVVGGQRVPCSIGYHFQIRGCYLHCHYTLRSCDFLLHFQDDMYLTMKLMQYVVGQLGILELSPGILTVSIDNLHCFNNERGIIKHKWEKLWNE